IGLFEICSEYSERYNVRITPNATISTIKFCDLIMVGAIELEIKNFKILFHTRRRHRFGNDNVSVGFCDGLEYFIVQNCSLTQWAPSFCGNIVLAMEQPQLILLELRVQFDLVDYRVQATFFKDPFEI